MDAHVARGKEMDDLVAGDSSLSLRGAFGLGGPLLNADITLQADDTIQISVHHDRNKPEAFWAAARHAEGLVAEQREGIPVHLRLWPPRVEVNAQRAGWLRAGYLVAFAAFGYRYVLDPALAIVRQQIKDHEVDIVGFGSCLGHPTEGFEGVRLFVVRKPEELRGLVVRFGKHAILLPRPGDLRFYARINHHLERTASHKEMAAIALEWPQEPRFDLDFWPPRKRAALWT